jgi:putative aldouronate transport system permease protein
MYGLLMAFKNYNASLGVLGSPWVGLENFQRIFITPRAIDAILNTVKISLFRIIFEFPVPIVLAIMFNEMKSIRLKRIYQTVFTFPHFLSWVIIAPIIKTFFGEYGAANYILNLLGINKISFLSSPSIFFPLIFLTANWKEAGWSMIIYMAAIAGINCELYEAAIVDGANRLQRIWYVTLPGIKSTMIVLLILAVGNSMNGGFDQLFNLRNPVVRSVSDIIDTYVYDITFLAVPNYSFSTAVGMFKSVVNALLLITANYVAVKTLGQALFVVKEERK